MRHNGGDVGRFNGLHPLFRAVPLGLVGAHPHRLVKARRDFTKRVFALRSCGIRSTKLSTCTNAE
jgi:hypothetical protein